MGNCKYCGKSAGLFRSQHSECTDKYNLGWTEMVHSAKSVALGEGNADNLGDYLSKVAGNAYIPALKVKEAIIKGWEDAVSHFLEDGDLSTDEEMQLGTYCNHFGLTQNDLNINGAYTKLIQGIVLREVMEGKTPKRIDTAGALPFNFQKAESLIWVFQNVDYL